MAKMMDKIDHIVVAGIHCLDYMVVDKVESIVGSVFVDSAVLVAVDKYPEEWVADSSNHWQQPVPRQYIDAHIAAVAAPSLVDWDIGIVVQLILAVADCLPAVDWDCIDIALVVDKVPYSLATDAVVAEAAYTHIEVEVSAVAEEVSAGLFDNCYILHFHTDEEVSAAAPEPLSWQHANTKAGAQPDSSPAKTVPETPPHSPPPQSPHHSNKPANWAIQTPSHPYQSHHR